MSDTAPRLNALRWTVLAAVVAVLLLIGWNAFIRDRAPEESPDPVPSSLAEIPPDPRLAFDTPFRNVKPEVQYVGDASCAPCHADIDKNYHQHPMGRSAAFVSKATPIERYDAAAHNPTTIGPYELRVEREESKVFHRVRAKDSLGKPLPDYVIEAELAIGSGTRGRSYVSLEQGAVWQTPISWFSPSDRWDLSPGFDLGNGGRRPILGKCVFCHVNQTEPVPFSVNKFREPFPTGQSAIGCERCHGPGQLHVTERLAGTHGGGIDTSIVNPKHLTSDLRDGICAQCHLQGQERVVRLARDLNDYRPGLPLELFLATYVRHPDVADLQRSVGQFEQMHESKCYSSSAGRMSCTTCHDPHSKPAENDRDLFYAKKCASCHQGEQKGCSERPEVRKNENDRCLACHMPRAKSSSIVHASITNHTIPRRPLVSNRPTGLEPGTIPLVLFPIGPLVTKSKEPDRDLGIALTQMIINIPAGGSSNNRGMLGSFAEDRLKHSVASWPGDAETWIALCIAREAQSDWNGALEAALRANSLVEDGEVIQGHIVTCAAALGKFDLAIEAATKLIRLNPSSIEPLLLRADVYLRQREWKKVQDDCQATLRIHPLHPTARLFLAICLFHQGDKAGSKREIDTAALLATKPRQRAAILEYYRDITQK